MVRKPELTPFALDCVWFDGVPNDTTHKLPTGAEDVYNPGLGQPYNEQLWRFTIDRHLFRINATFIDGSARTLRLGELWGLQWHRDYIPDTEVTFPRP